MQRLISLSGTNIFFDPLSHTTMVFYLIVQTVNEKIHFIHFRQDIVPVVEAPTLMGICVQCSY